MLNLLLLLHMTTIKQISTITNSCCVKSCVAINNHKREMHNAARSMLTCSIKRDLLVSKCFVCILSPTMAWTNMLFVSELRQEGSVYKRSSTNGSSASLYSMLIVWRIACQGYRSHFYMFTSRISIYLCFEYIYVAYNV